MIAEQLTMLLELADAARTWRDAREAALHARTSPERNGLEVTAVLARLDAAMGRLAEAVDAYEQRGTLELIDGGDNTELAFLERRILDATFSWFGARSLDGNAYKRELGVLEASEELHARVAELTAALTGLPA